MITGSRASETAMRLFMGRFIYQIQINLTDYSATLHTFNNIHVDMLHVRPLDCLFSDHLSDASNSDLGLLHLQGFRLKDQ